MSSQQATNKYRKFGIAPEPIKLDGAFADYAKPDYEFIPLTNRTYWCSWIYNGQSKEWLLRTHKGRAQAQLTTTESYEVAVATWNLYCDEVERRNEMAD